MKIEATAAAEKFRASGFDRFLILDALRFEDLPDAAWKKKAAAAWAALGHLPSGYNAQPPSSLSDPASLGARVAGHCLTACLIFDTLALSTLPPSGRIRIEQQREGGELIHTWLRDRLGHIIDPTAEQTPLLGPAFSYAKGQPARRPMRAESQGIAEIFIGGLRRRLGAREAAVLLRIEGAELR